MSAIPRITDANRRWWVLAGTGCGLAIVLLDEVLVSVALPTIRDELGISQLSAQWVVNAYVLALTVSVAAAGRIGDLLGRGRVLIAGATLFAAGTLTAGLAQSGEVLIAARAVQGLGTAAILSLGVAMIGIAFPQHERGLAVSVYGLIGAAPAAFGPLIGGLLTDVASWRGVFLVNLPLVATMIAVVALAWREPERGSARSSFDAPGLALLLAWLVPLVLALMQAPVWGWGSSAVIGLLAVAGVALAAFVRVERRTPDPLIDLDLLRNPTLVGANLVLFCAQFSKIAVLVFGSFYLQDRLGMSALIAGAALLAAMVPTLLTAVWSGLLTDRLGSRRPTLAGVVGTTLALALLAIAVPAGSYVLLLPGLVIWGIALPFLFNPPWTAVLNAVVADKRGEASGVAGTGRMLGSTLAVAVLGAVLVASESFPAVFWIAAAVSAAVLAAAFRLIERPPRGRAAAAAPSRAE